MNMNLNSRGPVIRVRDARPGDLFESAGERGYFVGAYIPHPMYPTMALVVWWLEKEGKHSLDALHPDQEILGTFVSNSRENLIFAITGGQRRS